MTERPGDWMQSYTGRKFWPLDPRPEEIFIEDIAHALSCLCRYGGHTKQFYSVAQHSCLVSRLVPKQDAKWGLLHDAAEAYLVDLPRPIKRYSEIGVLYQHIERAWMLMICLRFNLPLVEPESIRIADDRMLVTEKRDLMPSCLKWREAAEPIHSTIDPMGPEDAERYFWTHWNEITRYSPDVQEHTAVINS